MVCNLSDGKSPTFITLQPSQKEKYKISWRREGRRKGHISFQCSFKVAFGIRVAALCTQHNPARKAPFICIFLPGDNKKCFLLLFSHYSVFLLRKTFTFIQENLGLVEFLLFLLIFASAEAPGVNKGQILFYAFPAPACPHAGVGNAFQLPLLYSFLPLHCFYSLPGISAGGNGLLTAPGFS